MYITDCMKTDVLCKNITNIFFNCHFIIKTYNNVHTTETFDSVSVGNVYYLLCPSGGDRGTSSHYLRPSIWLEEDAQPFRREQKLTDQAGVQIDTELTVYCSK